MNIKGYFVMCALVFGDSLNLYAQEKGSVLYDHIR